MDNLTTDFKQSRQLLQTKHVTVGSAARYDMVELPESEPTQQCVIAVPPPLEHEATCSAPVVMVQLVDVPEVELAPVQPEIVQRLSFGVGRG